MGDWSCVREFVQLQVAGIRIFVQLGYSFYNNCATANSADR